MCADLTFTVMMYAGSSIDDKSTCMIHLPAIIQSDAEVAIITALGH
jgi:hypothetical protein